MDIGYATCDIASGILAVVRALHATFPMAQLIVTSVLPRGTNLMGADDRIRAVNLALAQAAAPGGFAFFDVHDALTCGHKTPCPLFVPDLNLHLTGAGYDLLTSRLRAFVSTLKSKDD
jgi:lysophospholipase L1-like esterase